RATLARPEVAIVRLAGGVLGARLPVRLLRGALPRHVVTELARALVVGEAGRALGLLRTALASAAREVTHAALALEAAGAPLPVRLLRLAHRRVFRGVAPAGLRADVVGALVPDARGRRALARLGEELPVL